MKDIIDKIGINCNPEYITKENYQQLIEECKKQRTITRYLENRLFYKTIEENIKKHAKEKGYENQQSKTISA